MWAGSGAKARAGTLPGSRRAAADGKTIRHVALRAAGQAGTRGLPIGLGLVVGVLETDDIRRRRAKVGRGRLARQRGNPGEPGEHRFRADRVAGRHPGGLVEGAREQLDDWAPRVPIAQGRAAHGAEIAQRARRRLKGRRCVSRPGELVLGHLGQHGKGSADGLLAHATVADADLDWVGIKGKAYGTALATTAVAWRSLQTSV